jgi:hypothetical protein
MPEHTYVPVGPGRCRGPGKWEMPGVSGEPLRYAQRVSVTRREMPKYNLGT